MTFSEGLEHSINSVFCNVGKAIGAGLILDYAKRYGFYSRPPLDLPPGEIYPSGLYKYKNGIYQPWFPKDPATQVDPGRLAFGQEQDARDAAPDGARRSDDREQGVEPKPYLVQKIVAADGSTVSKTAPQTLGRVIKPETARELNRMMQLVVEGGTGTEAQIPGVAVAGKTGTAETNSPASTTRGSSASRPRPTRATSSRSSSRSSRTGSAARSRRRSPRPSSKNSCTADDVSTLWAAVAVSDSLIDTLFDGRYRIQRKLGAGGMADVYLAEDQELGRRVAIKILNSRHGNDDQFIERFRREAKNAAALNHPNIVSIYDRGEAEDTYYIAMEFLDGRTLKELIIGRGAAPVNVAIEYARQILSALRFAHRHGIVHRDIKPHNVLVDGEGRVKVTDFGIARAGTSQMTEAGSIVGTAQYLSPEQAKGGEVDPRSDLYSLGIVLYELLTGKTPFDGETPVEIAMKHLSATPQPPSKLRPDIPPELDMVVLRALAKNPDDRYQSADEMEADLERVARGASVAATTVDTATQVLRRPAAATAATLATAATMIAPPPATAADAPPPAFVEEDAYEDAHDRSRWPWWVALAFVIVAVIAGFFVWQELSGSKATVPVNSYVNEPLASAEQQIHAAGLVAVVNRASNERFKAGIVFKQDPAAGSKLPKGGTVTLTVSKGPPKVTVPAVVGQQWTQAEATLTNLGLKPEEHFVGGNTKGQVTATDPSAGQSVPKGSTVRVNVMSGPALGTVPNVIGDTVQQATTALQSAGFNYKLTYVQSDATQGQIVHQTPGPGSSEAKGTTVDLQVSNGPPMVTVPDVVGYTSQQAVQTLEAAGFLVSQQYKATDASQQNIVQSQNPLGNSQAPKGSTVIIVIGQSSPAPPPATTT